MAVQAVESFILFCYHQGEDCAYSCLLVRFPWERYVFVNVLGTYIIRCGRVIVASASNLFCLFVGSHDFLFVECSMAWKDSNGCLIS